MKTAIELVENRYRTSSRLLYCWRAFGIEFVEIEFIEIKSVAIESASVESAAIEPDGVESAAVESILGCCRGRSR